MSDPIVAQEFPYVVEVEQGKTYKWCACGRSSTQPFCDFSHQGTDMEPIDYTATETRKISFCGCKQSNKGAVCDGSHNRL
ncbi:MAG TPA: CDGSH iron-sulfur domain-containing protein [Rhodospirillales bacterium]|nr:CDGSH iron-sulfur domain-containing protein [Rhodospirillales bacterium]